MSVGFVSENLRCVYSLKHRTDYHRDNQGLVKEITYRNVIQKLDEGYVSQINLAAGKDEWRVVVNMVV